MDKPTGTLPVLPVPDVAAAIQHYVDVFGFTEVMRVPGPDGAIVTGQVQRQGCHIMFNRNPQDAGHRGGGIWLWVRIDGANIDAFHDETVASGATVREPLGDRFWGDRSFAVEDLNGYVLAFNKALAPADA